jgi:HEAT repeat protein
MHDPEVEILMNQSRSDDPERQIDAIHELLDRRAYEAVPALLDASKSSDAVVRNVAARALGNLGVKDLQIAGVALMDLLDDPEVIVRSEAVDSLGILRYAPAVGAVKELLLKDPEPLVRASAAETLGDLGDTTALAELVLALHDTDFAVQAFAANSIGLLGSPALLPSLQLHAENAPSAAVKAELHGARYRLGSAGDLDALLSLLESADRDDAVNCLNILTDLSSRTLPPSLASDAARIRTAITTLAQRAPILNAEVEQILARLAELDRKC